MLNNEGKILRKQRLWDLVYARILHKFDAAHAQKLASDKAKHE